MGQEVFSYSVHKDGRLRIFWEGKCVMTLGGARGRKLIGDLANTDDRGAQRLLQRTTGNFKRGNERQGH
jgi:hypothetical protein